MALVSEDVDGNRRPFFMNSQRLSDNLAGRRGDLHTDWKRKGGYFQRNEVDHSAGVEWHLVGLAHLACEARLNDQAGGDESLLLHEIQLTDQAADEGIPESMLTDTLK